MALRSPELKPLERRRFVPREALAEAFAGAVPLQPRRFAWILSASWIRIRRPVAESAESRGLVDTSALVALDQIDASLLPAQVAISAISLAELAAGLHASADSLERARRLQRLQLSEASFDAMPFDGACARAYGRLYAQLLSAGRKARGRRALDLLIAATAAAAGLPLCTANPADFAGLGKAVKVTSVGARP